MDELKEAYFTIDKGHTEVITMEALEQYRVENNLDVSFINQWKKLFDRDNTGVITLQAFCDILGLEVEEVRENRNKFIATVAPTQQIAVQPIAEDMETIRQSEIEALVDEAEKVNGNRERDIVKWLKNELDEKFGRLWHTFVIRGNYYAYYSYEAGNSYCFKKGSRIYVIYKTPIV